MPRLYEGHDGANIAACLLTVVDKFEIRPQLGTIMMDNAYNYETMMNAIQQSYPAISRNARLRCSGHVINLVVKAILCGERPSAFSKAIVGCSDADSFVLWRQLGAIGKVHNYIKWIMGSDQRRQIFLVFSLKCLEVNKLYSRT